MNKILFSLLLTTIINLSSFSQTNNTPTISPKLATVVLYFDMDYMATNPEMLIFFNEKYVFSIFKNNKVICSIKPTNNFTIKFDTQLKLTDSISCSIPANSTTYFKITYNRMNGKFKIQKMEEAIANKDFDSEYYKLDSYSFINDGTEIAEKQNPINQDLFQYIKIPSGSIIEIKNKSELNSQYLNKGEEIDFYVIKNVVVDGEIVISENTIIKGVVKYALSAQGIGGIGMFQIDLNPIQTIDDSKINTKNNSIQSKGKIKALVNGKDVLIKSETIFKLETDKDYFVLGKMANYYNKLISNGYLKGDEGKYFIDNINNGILSSIIKKGINLTNITDKQGFSLIDYLIYNMKYDQIADYYKSNPQRFNSISYSSSIGFLNFLNIEKINNSYFTWYIVGRNNNNVSMIAFDDKKPIYFNGQIKENEMKGELTDFNNNTYQGQFISGKFIGGTVLYSNGLKYEGPVKDNQLFGQGKLIFPDGGYYEGNFEKNQYNGQGVLNRPSTGQRYEGEFKNGQPHGNGIYWENGQPERCEFYEGKRIDQAYLIRQENRRAELVRQNERLAEEERQRKIQQQMEEDEESGKGAVGFAKALIFATPLVGLKMAGASEKELEQAAFSAYQDVYINDDYNLSSTKSTISSMGSGSSQNNNSNNNQQVSESAKQIAINGCNEAARVYLNKIDEHNSALNGINSTVNGTNSSSNNGVILTDVEYQVCQSCAMLASLQCQYNELMRIGAKEDAQKLLPNINRYKTNIATYGITCESVKNKKKDSSSNTYNQSKHYDNKNQNNSNSRSYCPIHGYGPCNCKVTPK